MPRRKTFEKFYFAACLAVSMLSCQIMPGEGQLKCDEQPCPADMYCRASDLRCYSEDGFPSGDSGVGPDGGGQDAESDRTNGTDTEIDTGEFGDACPSDDLKTSPGKCGCGVPDVDGDGDGVLDCEDECPFDETKTHAGPCGCDDKCVEECIEVKENESAIIACDEGVILSVKTGKFGDLEGYCDSVLPPLTSCQTDSPLGPIQDACEGKTECLVEADKVLYGEQCTRRRHYLVVEYICS